MPTAPTKPLIVISYAHENEPEKPTGGEVKWLSFVTGYLRPSLPHLSRSDILRRGRSRENKWSSPVQRG
jgi:hypothetical protein